MARILKRPMFNRGGSSNQGIMEGLVDRTGYGKGDIVERARELTPEMAELLGEFTPKTRIPLGSIGADLMSGKGFRDTAIDNYRTYTTADDKRNAAVQGSAVKLGLNQAIAEAKPDKSSVLAAEKKARYLLPPDATAQQIRDKTAEIIQSELRGKTYSPAANFEAAKRMYIQTYGEGGKAYYHAAFDQKVAPQVRASGQIPKGRIKMQDNGSYKTKNKSPGIYVDVYNGKVIEFDGNIAKEVPEYSALLR
jgi:hypothetical protein